MKHAGSTALHLLDAHEVVALLRAGKVSPTELIDVVERRLAATDAAVNAVPIRCFERAREAAARLAGQAPPAKTPPGYLYGLPVLIKDTQAVAGVLCTQGSPLLRNHIAKESSRLVKKLEEKGAIVVGKTNVPEFAAGSHSFNPLFPTTTSPWDTRASAGGSSGGAAAALASNQCWLASGSDLGGSLRTPAAFCGVVGLRPSPGRVPQDSPSGPLKGLHPIDGPMGRSVRDVGLFLDAMEGSEGWQFSAPTLPPGETYEAACVRGAIQQRRWRVAFSGLGCKVEPKVDSLCRQAAQLLAAGGEAASTDNISEVNLDWTAALRAFNVLRGRKFAAQFGAVLQKPSKASALLKPEIRWNAAVGMVPQASKMEEDAHAAVARLHEQAHALFQDIDILCAPATLDAAFDAEVRYPSEMAGSTFTNYLGWMAPACVVSVLPCPALVLPCGFLEDGRPVGLQLVGPPMEDARLLEAAARLEGLLGLPRSCPVPRKGSAPLNTKGPRTAAEAEAHHAGEVERFVQRYGGAQRTSAL